MLSITSLPLSYTLIVLGAGLILHPPLLRLSAHFLIGEDHPVDYRFYLVISLVLTGITFCALTAFPAAHHILGVEPGDDGTLIAVAFGWVISSTARRESMSRYEYRRSTDHGDGLAYMLIVLAVVSPIITWNCLNRLLTKHEKSNELFIMMHYYGMLMVLYCLLSICGVF